MKNPEELREVTDHVLHELTADDSLKYRILQQAAQGKGKTVRRGFHPLPVLCTAVTALLIAVLVLNGLKPVDPASPAEMNVFAAGADETVHPEGSEGGSLSSLLHDVRAEDVTRIGISTIGSVSDPQQCAELIRILQEEAVTVRAADPSMHGKLTVKAGGIEYVIDAEDPFLSGDICCSCPAFFTKLREFTGQ